MVLSAFHACLVFHACWEFGSGLGMAVIMHVGIGSSSKCSPSIHLNPFLRDSYIHWNLRPLDIMNTGPNLRRYFACNSGRMSLSLNWKPQSISFPIHIFDHQQHHYHTRAEGDPFPGLPQPFSGYVSLHGIWSPRDPGAYHSVPSTFDDLFWYPEPWSSLPRVHIQG